MPKLKYTPGDWQFGFSDGSGKPRNVGNPSICEEGGQIVVGDKSVVVNGGSDSWGVPQGVVGRNQEEAEANGILLANAARMYEALRELLDKVQSVKWDGFDGLPAMRAKALIEKMEGEAK